MADWSFQDDCFNKIKQSDAGRIILPTGSGKSRIEFRVAADKMIRDDGIHQVVIITAPKIILCQQLIEEFYRYTVLKNRDVQELITFVSCGQLPTINVDIPELNIKETINLDDNGAIKTTTPEDVQNYLEVANQSGKDSIIFSTYHSFGRCVSGIKLAMNSGKLVNKNIEFHLIADEAHYFTLGKEDKENTSFNVLKDNLALFKTRFFFTATPKEYQGLAQNGMNNEKIYGKIIDERQPRELIKRGIICTPKMHIARLPDDVNENNFKSHVADFIMKTFERHEIEIKNACNNLDHRDKIGAKVLVAVDGSEQLLSIIKYDKFIDWANKNGIVVAWTMTNEYVDTYVYAMGMKFKLSIDKFLAKIRECGSNDATRMIILHHDRLTEGIDIPSMSALIPIRSSMSKDKMVQNIGRVMRAHKSDLSNPDRSTWIKPYSYIIIPDLPGIDKEFEELVAHMRSEYDSSIVIDKSNSAYGIEQDVPDMQNFEPKALKQQEIFGEIVHIIEDFNKWKIKIINSIEAGEEIDLTPIS